MVAGLAPHFVFDGYLSILFRADVLHFSLCMIVLFVTQCSIQGHSQIYMVGDMLKVLVIPCDIQLPACFSILDVESTCLCFTGISRK